MAALIMEPRRRYVVFPLVVPWQDWFACLSWYLPEVRFGLLTGAPVGMAGESLLQVPGRQVWQAFAKHYQRGELRQWQAYLEYLASQEDQDEQDLQAAIRGTLTPGLPPRLDREALWSLAYQLEESLAEKAAGLQRLAEQEKVLGQLLGAEPEVPADPAIDHAFSPPLAAGPADITLASLRLHFWQEILAPHLEEPWTAVVLEPAAGESSPRYLWEAAREAGQDVWQAEFRLPMLRLQAGADPAALYSVELGVTFRKTLSALLEAVSTDPAAAEQWRQTMSRLAVAQLWPAASLPQTQAISLQVYGRPAGAAKTEKLPNPMVFLSPAG